MGAVTKRSPARPGQDNLPWSHKVAMRAALPPWLPAPAAAQPATERMLCFSAASICCLVNCLCRCCTWGCCSTASVVKGRRLGFSLFLCLRPVRYRMLLQAENAGWFYCISFNFIYFFFPNELMSAETTSLATGLLFLPLQSSEKSMDSYPKLQIVP